MTQLARVLSGIGIASLALSVGCGAPMSTDSEEAALALPPKIKPKPIPLPLPGGGTGTRTDSDWAGYTPPAPVYPDYGVSTVSSSPSCSLPAPIDLEAWNGLSLWGTHTGIVIPYYTFNTIDRTAGDFNYGRWEFFGVDTDTGTVVWNMFGAPDNSTPGYPQIPLPLLNMVGTVDYYCHPVHFGSGGLASAKPPKDPPKPPDGGGSGSAYFCPAGGVLIDARDRILGCT